MGDARLRLGAAKAADMGDEVEELGGAHVGIGGRAFGQIADLPLGARSARARMSWPQTTAVPAVGARKPVIIFIVVDLPAPLGPRKPSTSPRRHRERHVVDRDERPEFPGEMNDLQHRRGLTSPVSEPGREPVTRVFPLQCQRRGGRVKSAVTSIFG